MKFMSVSIIFKYLIFAFIHLSLALFLSSYIMDQIRAAESIADNREEAFIAVVVLEAMGAAGDGFWKHPFSRNELDKLELKLRATNFSTDCQPINTKSKIFVLDCKHFTHQ